MCVVSNVGDHFSELFPQKYPSKPWEYPYQPISDKVSRSEHDQLKEEVARLREDVERMKEELIAAKRQDEEDGNPDCEMEEKVALLKKIAEAVGVDLSEVWPDETKS